MKETEIERIPIAEIRVVNPRSRNKTKFQEIVDSIAAVGLKRPISVSRRELDSDGTRYDLICGQGRMEACRALGETTIPAVMSDASREEQLLMSLVENLARRPPSNSDLLREVRNLAYVAISRGRYDAQIYTDNAKELAGMLRREVSKESALDSEANRRESNVEHNREHEVGHSQTHHQHQDQDLGQAHGAHR